MTETEKCYLCEADCSVGDMPARDICLYRCNYCGTYGISRRAKINYRNDRVERLKAACVSAERRWQKLDCYVILDEEYGDKICERPTIAMDSLVASYPRSALELLDRSLLSLRRMVNHPGDKIKLSTDHPTVLFSTTEEELLYIIYQFYKLNYIGLGSNIPAQTLNSAGGDPIARYLIKNGFCIQADGWRRVAELARTSAGGEAQAFVAMWFDPSVDNIYENGIEPAIERDCGIKCVKIDNVEHNNKICDEIIAEIRRSKFVVADFTGQRGGVYFEAGFAQGLGIPVIWTVRDSDVENLHFDTRQYNHVVYTGPEDLRTKLANRIRATIV